MLSGSFSLGGTIERPVEYASRLLTNAERNYPTTEREALVVVWIVNKIRGYIEREQVNLITDHQHLQWLMTLKSPTGRLTRWTLQLQPYDLLITYNPGQLWRKIKIILPTRKSASSQ